MGGWGGGRHSCFFLARHPDSGPSSVLPQGSLCPTLTLPGIIVSPFPIQERIEQWQKGFNFKTGLGRDEEQERNLLELLEPLELRLHKSTCDLTHIHNNLRERKL